MRIAIGSILLLAAPSWVAVQADSSVLPPERDLYLECLTDSEEVVGVTIAINASRERARTRPHNGTRARPTYGIAYEPTAIRLWPNRQAPNPPPMNFSIDRETLVLTYWKPTFPVTEERNIVATGQCREVEAEPDLMPRSRGERLAPSDQ